MDGLKCLQIVIARHGNTFDPGEEVLRCGARTDLPLSSSGRQQATALGHAFSAEFPEGFDAVYVSTLRRTQETARLALAAMAQTSTPIIVDALFDEIDYGPDEGRPETQVRNRLGLAALAAWDEKAVVPPGWLCDPQSMRQSWKSYFARIVSSRQIRTLVVTSNGVARFALANTTGFDGSGKLSTGAYGTLVRANDSWKVDTWNVRPPPA